MIDIKFSFGILCKLFSIFTKTKFFLFDLLYIYFFFLQNYVYFIRFINLLYIIIFK